MSNSEAEQNVKTFLDNKYGKTFMVNVIKYNEATSNESGMRGVPSYFNLQATSNGQTYYVVYSKDMSYSNDAKYPYSYEIIKENIEGRHWHKEVNDYYKKRISELCDDGYLTDVSFIVDRTPSRVGMSADEYINELIYHSSPLISIYYTIFVDDIDNLHTNNNVLNIFKTIDDNLRIEEHDWYFSEDFSIVYKKDKEEYIKKVDELNKITSDYYGSNSYDRSDKKSWDEYLEKSKPLNDWIKKAKQDCYSIERERTGALELKQRWWKP